jgi:nitroreductase
MRDRGDDSGFFAVVRARHSVRAFADQPVGLEMLRRILDTATRAPSAGNLQAYAIYAVAKRSAREALARAAFDQAFVAQAPVVLVFCAHPARSARRYGDRGWTLYCIQDATIACAYAQLAATALGLATVWVGAFDEDAVRRALDVPPDLRPVAILPIGYPAEAPEITGRRTLEDLVRSIR